MNQNKQWQNTYAVLEPYKNGKYISVDAGVRSIDPSRIIALSLPYEDIVTDHKMNNLRNSVDQYGWENRNPRSISLMRLPNGDYIVDGGGNHRAVVTNEKGIKQIQASVTVIMPGDQIDPQTISNAEKLQTAIVDAVSAEEADDLEAKRNQLLLSAAKSLGYI